MHRALRETLSCQETEEAALCRPASSYGVGSADRPLRSEVERADRLLELPVDLRSLSLDLGLSSYRTGHTRPEFAELDVDLIMSLNPI